MGAFEGATFCADYTPGKLPSITGISLPFLPWKGNHHIQRVIDAYMATEEPAQELANFGAMYYMTATVPAYEIIGTGEAPQSLSDLSGKKLRMVGGLADVLSRAGAVPVEVPSSETYTSMSQNLVDGAVLPYYAMLSYKAHEPGDWYTSGLQLGTISCGSVFSIDAYEALPQHYKDLLEEYKEVGYANVRPILAETDEIEAPQTFAEDGLTEVVIPDEDRQAMVDEHAQPVWDEWAASMDERGYDGQALIQRMLDIMAEEQAKLEEKGELSDQASGDGPDGAQGCARRTAVDEASVMDPVPEAARSSSAASARPCGRRSRRGVASARGRRASRALPFCHVGIHQGYMAHCHPHARDGRLVGEAGVLEERGSRAGRRPARLPSSARRASRRDGTPTAGSAHGRGRRACVQSQLASCQQIGAADGLEYHGEERLGVARPPRWAAPIWIATSTFSCSKFTGAAEVVRLRSRSGWSLHGTPPAVAPATAMAKVA